MLPPRHRLHLRSSVPFYTFAYKAHFPVFSLFWQVVADEKPSQAAFVVPKKVAPTAVRRNRLKRVLSARFSTLLPLLPSHVDIVVVVRRDMLENELDNVMKLIEQKCHR